MRLIAWHKADRRFVAIDRSMLDQDLASYLDLAGRAGLVAADLPQGARLWVLGDEWTRDSHYVGDLAALVGAHDLDLATYLHTAQYLDRSHRAATLDGPAAVLATMIAASRVVVVPSAGTAAELERYASERGIAPVRTAVVRPADRFIAPSDTRSAAARPLPTGAFTLAVAVDGIGEDERLLAKVWKRVAAETDRPQLVIATAAASAALNDWAAGVRSDGIEVRFQVSEAELDALYDAAGIVVGTGRAAARVLSEAVARGKIAVGPQTPATEDAVGNAADLIDPLDLKRWVARLVYYLRSRTARQAGADRAVLAQPTGWADTAAALLAATAQRQPPRGAYIVGLKTRLADRPGSVRKRAGWHPAEPWGCWSAARTASFDFVLAEPAAGALALGLELRSPLTGRQENVCDIVVNGVAVGQVILRGAGWRFFTIPLPATAIAGGTTITVEIRGTRLIELAKVYPGEAPGRRGGIALAAVALIQPTATANYADYPTFAESTLGTIGFGEEIDLVRDPRAVAILPERSVIGSDWGARHADYRAQLLVEPLGRMDESCTLTLRYRAVASPDQPITALATTREGVFLGRIETDDDTIRETRLHIPAHAKVQPLLIEFLGAPKVSPQAVGVGLSDNAFGIGFFGLRIDRGDNAPPRNVTAEPYPLGTLVRFGSFDGDPLALSAAQFWDPAGWHDQEPTGAWSQHGGGELALRLPAVPGRPVHVRIDATCARDPAGPVGAEVRVGGTLIHVEPRYDDQLFAMEFTIDPGLVEPDGTIRLALGTDHAVVPSRSATWRDDRRLGLLVHSLMVAEDADTLRGSTPPGYGRADWQPSGYQENAAVAAADATVDTADDEEFGADDVAPIDLDEADTFEPTDSGDIALLSDDDDLTPDDDFAPDGGDIADEAADEDDDADELVADIDPADADPAHREAE